MEDSESASGFSSPRRTKQGLCRRPRVYYVNRPGFVYYNSSSGNLMSADYLHGINTAGKEKLFTHYGLVGVLLLNRCVIDI